MTKILVLYFSMSGHIESMAGAGEEGVRCVPEAVARGVGAKLNQAAPIATTDELPEYDEIIFGTPTRFGSMFVHIITSFHGTLLHHGMVIVGVPYAGQALVNMDEITGGSPYGAGTVAGNGDVHAQFSVPGLKVPGRPF